MNRKKALLNWIDKAMVNSSGNVLRVNSIRALLTCDFPNEAEQLIPEIESLLKELCDHQALTFHKEMDPRYGHLPQHDHFKKGLCWDEFKESLMKSSSNFSCNSFINNGNAQFGNENEQNISNSDAEMLIKLFKELSEKDNPTLRSRLAKVIEEGNNSVSLLVNLAAIAKNLL